MGDSTMSILVKCAGCQTTMKAPDTTAGKMVRCPKCGEGVAVPAGGVANGATSAAVPKKEQDAPTTPRSPAYDANATRPPPGVEDPPLNTPHVRPSDPAVRAPSTQDRPADANATRLTLSPMAMIAAAAVGPTLPGYEIVGELGRGGMGVVYKARHIKSNRVVALKMILTSKHASMQEQIRFQIEAEAVAHLQHPNIVQLHDVGEHEGVPFFSLEYCDGGALDCKLKTWTPAAAEAAALVETLARSHAPRPSARRRPPRPQAGQRAAKPETRNSKSEIRIGRGFGFRISDFGFCAEDYRLRPRQEARFQQRPQPHRRRHGYAVVHGAGTGGGSRPRHQSRYRRVCPGRDSV